METMIRTCRSSVKDFAGCDGQAREGVVSCAPCFAEYERRSRALDRKRKEERERLIAILQPMTTAGWEDRPKVRVLFSNFFSHQNEGKVAYYNGRYLLMKQRNSRKGYVITYEVGSGDAVKVEVLDRKGKTINEWHSETAIASGSVEAKRLADQYESEEKCISI